MRFPPVGLFRASKSIAILSLLCIFVNAAEAQVLSDGFGGRSSSMGTDPSGNAVNAGNSDKNSRDLNLGNPVAPQTKIDPIQVYGSDRPADDPNPSDPNPRVKQPAPPSEFEQFVKSELGRPLPRFGANLLLPSNRDYAVPSTATIPPSYVLNIGDIVAISMSGSIEGSVAKKIGTDGKIYLPRVGAIALAGVRYGDLKSVISTAIGTQFRGYTVNVGVSHLRGIRVYVTGFANNPGAYTVNSLSTMVNAVLAAGGPSSGGSFRSVKLYRNNELISNFDLYSFILGGDKSKDAILQNQDVLVIPPVGEQVAITGSVNTEAIYEAKPGETLTRLLTYAGGTNNLADTSRLMLYRYTDFNSVGVQEISRDAALTTLAKGGDIVQILSEGSLIRSIAKQSILVRIEGEVNTPGSYYVPADTTLSDVISKAGGLSSRAFVFGTRFQRTSVRKQQRVGVDEAINQLEFSLAASPLSADQSINTGERTAQLAGAHAVVDKLRTIEPDGRMVLDISPTANTLSGDFVLENNDSIIIPSRPSTVGVFGAVYQPASFLMDASHPMSVSSYIERAGGTVRYADTKSIFVVHANGAVVSSNHGATKGNVIPGDVIFVPIKTQSSSVWAKIQQISSILFQFGFSAAAFKTIGAL
jgi:protein involved in polysaccharide export with SLBB domain